MKFDFKIGNVTVNTIPVVFVLAAMGVLLWFGLG